MARIRTLHNLSLFAGALAVASMITACGGGSSEPAGDESSGSETQAPAESSAPAQARATASNASASSAPPSATGDEIPTQATSAGAVQLFVDAMREGDYETAKLVCHPQALGQDKLDQMLEALSKAREVGEQEGADEALKNLDQLILSEFVRHWRTVDVRRVAEQGDKARYHLSFVVPDAPDGRASRAIDVFEIDETWFVFIPEWVDIPLTQIMMDPANDGAAPAPDEAAPAQG